MLTPIAKAEVLSSLRKQVAEGRSSVGLAPQTFGFDAIDSRLAGRGMDGTALHEFAAATASLGDDAAVTLFIAGVAARFAVAADARIIWAVSRFDLYAPGLEQAGLPPSRIVFAQGRDDKEVLALVEDALRHGTVAAVVAEVNRADMIATRRLQLAAEAGGTPALLLRRWRRRGVCPLGEMSAATTRWRIGCAPSVPLPFSGVGRARWTVDLVRQRNGDPFSLMIEACDDTGRLAVPAGAADRAAPAVRAALAA